MLSSLLSGLGVKIAAGALAVSAAAGGVAAANGQLPPAAQDAVASVAAKVNIDLPRHNQVLETVFQDGLPTGADRGFGEDVAGTASDGLSDAGLDTADGADGDGPDDRPDGSQFQPDLP